MMRGRDPWPRAAGVLLHPTSLPGAGGCGDIGPTAHEFVDFLAEAGQTWWQTLPVGPAGKGFSPYSARSSFAGGVHLISIDLLAQDGLLDPVSDEAQTCGAVHLESVRARHETVRAAAARFLAHANQTQRTAFHEFVDAASEWLDDWALYESLSRAERSHDWTRWPKEVRLRDAGALVAAQDALEHEILLAQVEQFFFHDQWTALRSHCLANGVRLMGDVPFYPSLESADVWASQSLFELDANGQPAAVAGVPPDYFSATGQIWESPIYRWEAHESTDFAWWSARLGRAAELFDAVRIDHFLGMHRYWRVPHGAATAEHGAWAPSPGRELLTVTTSAHPALQIVAEDLGLITTEASALRDAFGFPGMRVLQFAFDADTAGLHRPDQHPENAVVYTGTHDNDTTVGWAESMVADPHRAAELKRACDWFNVEPRELPDAMIRAAMASPAHTAVLPMQDVLGLGTEARMNRPGIAEGNWRWRLRGSEDLRSRAEGIQAMTLEHGRTAGRGR